jgi:formylglycine-generating enzyme required for sulfatase activity
LSRLALALAVAAASAVMPHEDAVAAGRPDVGAVAPAGSHEDAVAAGRPDVGAGALVGSHEDAVAAPPDVGAVAGARSRGSVDAPAAPAASHVPAAEPSPDVLTNSVGMRMVRIAPGSFLMGSPPGEPLRQDEETPRRVALTRVFRMAATEVTGRQWLGVMPGTPNVQPGDHPVASVSWAEATEFCAELSRREGRSYRLPTEAEWEYACRAGAPSGAAGADLASVAWYSENSEGATHPVAQKAPNAWGLHDMLGNAAEWTLDAYGPYAKDDPVRDPRGPEAGTGRVVRGGSWRSFPPALRCAARAGTPPSYQLAHVGLRVVQEVE